jgi:Carboxylesterase family
MPLTRIYNGSTRAKKRLLRAVMPVAVSSVAVGLAVTLTTGASAAPRVTASSAGPPACTAGTLVHTKDGPVCGTTAAGETSYLDIPYAAPPVGQLRWKPPQPVKHWTATYQATQRGPGRQWTGFARTGQPTASYTPLWPPYTTRSQLVMSLQPGGDGALTPASTIMMQHNCGFWDAVNRTAS